MPCRMDLKNSRKTLTRESLKITTETGKEDNKMDAALTCIEEVKTWNSTANCALQEIMKEQKIMMDKLGIEVQTK